MDGGHKGLIFNLLGNYKHELQTKIKTFNVSGREELARIHIEMEMIDEATQLLREEP